MTKRILGLAALLFLCAIPAHAQFLGYTSPQTVTQNVFNAASCSSSPLKSVSLTNVGQSIHVVTYSVSGSANPNAIVRIMGSSDNTTFVQLSDDGMGGVGGLSGSLTGYGSYPFVQVWVIGGGAGCVTTINYVGTSVGATNPTTGTNDATAYQKLVFGTALDSTSPSVTFTPPYGNTGGILIFAPVGGAPPAGSTLFVQSTAAGGGPGITFTISAVATAQVFVVPNFPGSTVTVSFFSGGASSNFFSLFYLFSKPGTLPITPQCEQIKVINTAAAGPTQIIAPLSGQAVHVCSLSVSSGTAEAVDFQQGTGANCGTGNSQLTGLYHLAANTPGTQLFPTGGLVGLTSNGVCIHLSGANQTDGTITYSVY